MIKEKKLPDYKCPILIIWVGCGETSNYESNDTRVDRIRRQIEGVFTDETVKVLVMEDNKRAENSVEYINPSKKFSKMTKEELLKLAEKMK